RIHAIVCSLVLTSGAGTSESGPSVPMILDVYRRVSRSSSFRDRREGLQRTPPFAPPNGTSTTAHFHVIHAASARTSSAVTEVSKRIPPLPGPLAVLWITL